MDRIRVIMDYLLHLYTSFNTLISLNNPTTPLVFTTVAESIVLTTALGVKIYYVVLYSLLLRK
jgi:hypothetical protein